MKPFLLIVSLFLFNALTSCYSAELPPTVTLQNGTVTVIGTTLTEVSLNKPIYRFLGVPYGEPPIGPLRFRKPIAWKAKSTTTINATDWGNLCFNSAEMVSQGTDFIEYVSNSKKMSEDCLFVNIWTPAIDDSKLRPVIFTIAGGGLKWDSSSYELFNGETLAARADAIVVSLSYRLSTLGFLYSDQVPEIPGNQGLWDQALALKWVQENIRHFGGDPNKVTIRGEGAGSYSVTSHVLSPVSRDLFSNAIIMSGAVSFKVAKSKEKQVFNQLKGIRSVGCATEGDRTIDRKIVECLEKLDAKEVDKIAYMLHDNSDDFGGQVTIDGEFFPDTPQKMLATGNHKKNFNILLSTDEDEGSFLLYLSSQVDSRFARNNPTPLTLEGAQQYLLDIIAKNVLYTSELPNKTISSFYFSGLNGNFDSQNLFRKQAGIAYGDLWLGCPTIGFAKKIFASSPDINVYQWYFTAKLGHYKKWSCSEWAGACHCNEISLMFGTPFRIPQNYVNRERDISAEIIDIVSNFIRNGTPGKFQPEWNKYFLETQNGKAQIVAPYYELSSEPKSYRSFKYNLKQFECETIWDKFIDDPKTYN